MADLKDHPSLDGLKAIEKLATRLASCRHEEETTLSKAPQVSASSLEKLAFPGIEWERAHLARENQIIPASAARRDCEAKAVIDTQRELISKAFDRVGHAADADGIKAVDEFRKTSKVVETMYGSKRDSSKNSDDTKK